MRKIRLSDMDIEFFDLEVSPAEFVFFQKHKDAFRCMWKEQGKPFWTKFSITFRSFTVKHGVIKQMSCDSPKFENLVDQAFIYIHEQFVDGKESAARGFIEDCARLAQNHDKFPHLDSKSFSKDPFYSKDTRDLFRRFFGSPDQKSSYVKVYVLSPIYLRFGGSICRCLKRWMDAPPQDCSDESYWVPPSPQHTTEEKSSSKVLMCTKCLDDCGTLYLREKKFGEKDGPKYMDYWKLGNPRVNDCRNPLYDPCADEDGDWREDLTVEDFRDFVHYAKFKYGKETDKCSDCSSLDNNKESNLEHIKCHAGECVAEKKKKKKKKNKTVETPPEDDKKDDIQKLVDHITGKCTLEEMPLTTIGGIEARDGPSQEKDAENKRKKKIFTRPKITDDFKYGILSAADELSTGNVVGGFKVIKIEDERTGAREISITVSSVKRTDDEKTDDVAEKKDYQKSKIRNLLTADMIRCKIDNLPQKLEWWEGCGWCASVINYEEEEKGLAKHYTNFTIKVSGMNEDSVKRTMFKLLFYVSKRKKRPCPGWTMDDDDVVACILPEETTDQEGLTICIQKGFRFEERLTEEERKTLVKPSDRPERPQVLMALDGGVAEAAAKGPFGIENLKKLITRITGKCIEELDIGNNNMESSSMWQQIKTEPRTFEMLIIVNQSQEEELKALGLRVVDLDLVYTGTKKKDKDGPLQKKCRKCDSDVYDCSCFDKSLYDKPLTCNCKKCEYKQKTDINLKQAKITTEDNKQVTENEKKEKCDEKGNAAEPESKPMFKTEPQKSSTKTKKSALKPEEKNVFNFTAKSPENDQAKDTQVTVHRGPPADAGGPPDLLKMASASFSLTFNNEDGTPIEDPETALEEALHELSDRLDAESLKKKEAEASGKTQQPAASTKKSRAAAKKAKKAAKATSNPNFNDHQLLKIGNLSQLSKLMNQTSVNNIHSTRTLEDIQDEQINMQDLGAAKIAMMGGIGRPITENENGKGRLKSCTTCGKSEPSPKTFKKCQKCKQEGISNARYYCGRECQVMDWNQRHRLEHKENKLE